MPAQAATTVAWQILPQGGVRQVLVPDARSVFPFDWTPLGTLLVVSYDGAGIRTLWMASDDGSMVVRQVAGAFAPLALSRDGETLYALGRPDLTPVSALYTIDLRTDRPRTIADADRLGALVEGRPVIPGAFTFLMATVAPDESHLAVVIQRAARAGTPGPAPTASETLLIFLWPDGNITGIVRLAPGVWPGFLTWSPDGEYLAFYGTANGAVGATTGNLFTIVDRRGARRASLPFYLGALYGGMNISWSPDSRWLAYSSIAGIDLVGVDAGRVAELASPGGYPVWQPRSRP